MYAPSEIAVTAYMPESGTYGVPGGPSWPLLCFQQHIGFRSVSGFVCYKILAYHAEIAIRAGLGAVQINYLLYFHQHIGISDKVFIFIKILAL